MSYFFVECVLTIGSYGLIQKHRYLQVLILR